MLHVFKLTGALLIAFPALAMAQGPVRLDVSIEQNENSLAGKTVAHFAELVHEKTDGQVELTVHYSGVLGYKSSGHFAAVETGAVPIASTPQTQISGVSPIFEAQGLPFIARDFSEAKKLDDALKPQYDQVFSEANQVLLFTSPWDPQGFWMKDELTSIEDLSGLKIRTVDRIAGQVMENAGAVPLPMSWGDVPTAISTGAIDAVLTSADGGASVQFWELGLDHFSNATFSISVQLVHMNQGTYDDLSDAQKEAFKAASEESEAFGWNLTKEMTESVLAELESDGVAVAKSIPDTLRVKLQNATEPVFADWLKRAGSVGEEVMSTYKTSIGASE